MVQMVGTINILMKNLQLLSIPPVFILGSTLNPSVAIFKPELCSNSKLLCYQQKPHLVYQKTFHGEISTSNSLSISTVQHSSTEWGGNLVLCDIMINHIVQNFIKLYFCDMDNIMVFETIVDRMFIFTIITVIYNRACHMMPSSN